jgi:hypothetical protein
VYIYDKRGLEVHCLREHEHVNALEFLRRFFLLVSVGESGVLRYQDTSTGVIVAQHRTRLGRRDADAEAGHAALPASDAHTADATRCARTRTTASWRRVTATAR